MKHRLDSREFAEWQAFDRISPISDDRLDLLAGIITSQVCQCLAGGKGRRLRPADFMPKYRRREQSSPAAVGAAIGLFVEMHNDRMGKGA